MNWALKMHNGVEIELHMQCSCIHILIITRSRCSSDLNVCMFAGSSTVTLRCMQVDSEGLVEVLQIQGDSMA